MEALVAIGLAGNIVQFVQFAGTLASEVECIRRTGSPSSLPSLKTLTEDLSNQCHTIKTQLARNASPLSQEDEHLLTTATHCCQASAELMAYLDDLLPDPSSSRLFRSVRTSMKITFRSQKIQDLLEKIDRFRNALLLSSIFAFRASANTSTEGILKQLKILEEQTAPLNQGSDELLGRTQELRDILQGQTGPRLETLHKKVEACLSQFRHIRDELPSGRETQILRWLDFRQRQWRYESVPLTYQKTFEWIFEMPDGERHWDSLVSYLSEPAIGLPYFISGKAGSGKSTLMKFIVKHPKTIETLKIWSGNGELMVSTFFFWNLGTDLQKTPVGMLRTLLHDILKSYPELIPAVFGEMYQSWNDEAGSDAQPEYIEVKAAFQRLIIKSARFLKLCIFIDGIDELEGDHKDLSEFLLSMASSSHVKLVLSSRPIVPCVNAFRGCPTQQLHELTDTDVALFIRDNLGSHPSMFESITRFPPGEVENLMHEIRSKAAGVFLWVAIVVRLLIDGIESGDDSSDLTRKLESLPPDLRDLYRRMMSKMEKSHQSQASEIFELLETWKNIQPNTHMPTILLSFASQPASRAFDQKSTPMDRQRYLLECKYTEARVRTRCCGLLEVHKIDVRQEDYDQTQYVTYHEMERSYIGYLHRTVAEFLNTEEVRVEIHTANRASCFKPLQRLASAGLSLIKFGDFSHKDDYLMPQLEVMASLFRQTPFTMDCESVKVYLRAIDEVITAKHREGTDPSSNHWSACVFPFPGSLSSIYKLDRLSEFASIWSFASRTGLYSYLVDRPIAQSIASSSGSTRLAMAGYALQSWLYPYRDNVSLRLRTDVLLSICEQLKSERSVKTYDFGFTLWDMISSHLSELICHATFAAWGEDEPIADDPEDLRMLLKQVQDGHTRRDQSHDDISPHFLDCAVLVGIGLVTTEHFGQVRSSIPPRLDLVCIVSALLHSDDTKLAELGTRLTGVILANVGTRSVDLGSENRENDPLNALVMSGDWSSVNLHNKHVHPGAFGIGDLASSTGSRFTGTSGLPYPLLASDPIFPDFMTTVSWDLDCELHLENKLDEPPSESHQIVGPNPLKRRSPSFIPSADPFSEGLASAVRPKKPRSLELRPHPTSSPRYTKIDEDDLFDTFLSIPV